jgi:hypothetical protein
VSGDLLRDLTSELLSRISAAQNKVVAAETATASVDGETVGESIWGKPGRNVDVLWSGSAGAHSMVITQCCRLPKRKRVWSNLARRETAVSVRGTPKCNWTGSKPSEKNFGKTSEIAQPSLKNLLML